MPREITRKRIATTLVILALSTALFSPISAFSQQATTAADLVSDESVVYSLPQAGTILPTHPLFPIKQLKDSLQIMTATYPLMKARLILQISDQYISYAQKLLEMNKPESALSALEDALNYRTAVTLIVVDLKNVDEFKNNSEFQQLHLLTIQSNVKQSEIIRQFLTQMPSGEQDVLVSLLERTIQLRKSLE